MLIKIFTQSVLFVGMCALTSPFNQLHVVVVVVVALAKIPRSVSHAYCTQSEESRITDSWKHMSS